MLYRVKDVFQNQSKHTINNFTRESKQFDNAIYR